MQKSLLKNKWVRLLIVTVICAIAVFIGTYSALGATEEAEVEEKIVTVVNSDDEETVYDINSSEDKTVVESGEV